MSYTEFREGYAIEATPGTSIITAVGDTAYKMGAVSQKCEHPSPKALMRYTATGVGSKEVAANLLWKAQYSLRGVYGFVLQNGLPLYLAMGDSSTAGAVHTLVPTTNESPIPSFTYNIEQRGTATNEEFQFLGCKIDSLSLLYDLSEPEFLMAKIEVMAMKAQDGIALTTAPALPATANANIYNNLTRTWDYGGTPVAIDGLQNLEIVIENGLMPKYAHSVDTGVYTGMWPYVLLEAPRKQYRIIMDLHPNVIERKLWDELIATGTNKEIYFKWTRSATDYIAITATDCFIIEHEKITPEAGETLIERIVIEPRALSIAVSDAVAAARYGD
jgi:hypothetical protein